MVLIRYEMKKQGECLRPQFRIQKRLLWLPVLLLSTIALLSCRKAPDDPPPVLNDTTVFAKGVFVLNEGLFNQNNASLTFYSFDDSVAEANYFFNRNGRGLGDTGSDACIYGSKLYLVVNVSSQVEIAEASTGKSLVQIPLFDGNKPRQPRKIAAYGKYVFVCNFDNTVAVIDTARLAVEKLIEAGPNPDGITAAYGRIWVSNSGGLAFPDYGNTVSVINPETLTEEMRFTVGVNPYMIKPDGNGNLFLISRGNYSDIKSRLQVMDASDGSILKTFDDFEALGFTIAGDSAFVYNFDWISGSSSIRVINTRTMQLEDDQFISDGTALQTVYGIAFDPVSGLIYIADALSFSGPGRVFAFDKSGKRQFSFNAGVNPAYFAFLNHREINESQPLAGH